MKKQQNGFLIAVEGIDGSGKSSLCNQLKEKLSLEFSVILTKEPGGTPLGKGLRETLLRKDVPVCAKAEFLLFATDRAQHFDQVIIPALEKNTVVISDRMADSSLVYQGYGRSLDTTTLSIINDWAMNSIQPDLVIYLKISPEKAYERMAKRNIPLNSFEKEIAFMHKLEKGFDELFAQRDTVLTLDATESIATLTEKALEHIKKCMRK